MAANADKNLASIAQRLGLSIAEGDGNVNLLYFQQPVRDFSRTIRLAGQPYGRPVEFLITDGQKTSEYRVARKITTTFGCWLETKASALMLPPFEVALRSPNQYLVAPQNLADRPQMAEASTGDPQLDAKFVVRTSDPRIAPALVPALRAISGELYVHIAGEGERLWSSITRMGLPYSSWSRRRKPSSFSSRRRAASRGAPFRRACESAERAALGASDHRF